MTLRPFFRFLLLSLSLWAVAGNPETIHDTTDRRDSAGSFLRNEISKDLKFTQEFEGRSTSPPPELFPDRALLQDSLNHFWKKIDPPIEGEQLNQPTSGEGRILLESETNAGLLKEFCTSRRPRDPLFRRLQKSYPFSLPLSQIWKTGKDFTPVLLEKEEGKDRERGDLPPSRGSGVTRESIFLQHREKLGKSKNSIFSSANGMEASPGKQEDPKLRKKSNVFVPPQQEARMMEIENHAQSRENHPNSQNSRQQPTESGNPDDHGQKSSKIPSLDEMCEKYEKAGQTYRPCPFRHPFPPNIPPKPEIPKFLRNF